MTETVSPPKKFDRIEHIVHVYGDLLFDLCESILWSPENAQIAFRTILKNLKSGSSENQFSAYERAWVLRIACEELRALTRKFGTSLTPSEQIRLDSNANFNARMEDFELYFRRLDIDDQLVLLLRDKYGLTYDEIASALGVPEGSVRVSRQQALRAMEEWLWSLR